MNCSNPQVSVIVPNYNHAKFLRARLDSILNQTFQDFELILLDDCSTDNSVEILGLYAGHPKVSHFVGNDQNSGSPFVQWERGIALARGEFIWLAESDDVAESEFLEEMVHVLNGKKNVVLAYCRSEVIDGFGHRHGDVPWCTTIADFDIASDYEAPGLQEIHKKLAFYNSIPNTSAVLLRRDALRQVQLPLGMICCGDWITWIRVLRLGDIAYCSRKMNLYRSHIGASTRAPQSYERAVRTVLEFGLAAREAKPPISVQVRRMRRYSMLRDVWCSALFSYPEVRAAGRNLPFMLSLMVHLGYGWRFTWNWIRMNRISRNVRSHFRKIFPENV